jgi:hypothetical protein
MSHGGGNQGEKLVSESSGGAQRGLATPHPAPTDQNDVESVIREIELIQIDREWLLLVIAVDLEVHRHAVPAVGC